ncbi:MAG: hypothetical protein K9G33_07760 [Sneathiella sp.]|nr:hypothetical protein [Sneathiella sp.]
MLFGKHKLFAFQLFDLAFIGRNDSIVRRLDDLVQKRSNVGIRLCDAAFDSISYKACLLPLQFPCIGKHGFRYLRQRR